MLYLDYCLTLKSNIMENFEEIMKNVEQLLSRIKSLDDQIDLDNIIDYCSSISKEKIQNMYGWDDINFNENLQKEVKYRLISGYQLYLGKILELENKINLSTDSDEMIKLNNDLRLMDLSLLQIKQSLKLLENRKILRGNLMNILRQIEKNI